MTGTSGGSGERDATQPLRDKEEGLASVEVEEQRGRPSPRCGVQQRGPKVCTQWPVLTINNNSQSAVYKSQAGRYGYT